MAEGIEHLDFEPECGLMGCEDSGVWCMNFSQCLGCGADGGWQVLCQTHGLQAIRHRKATHACLRATIEVLTWKEL